MDKKEVAQVLEEMALLLELAGENPFKVRAYEAGARAVLTLPGDLEEAVRTGELARTKGIGKSLGGVIQELVQSGSASFHEELKNKIPPGLLELLQVPGLGPKKARLLHDKLQIASLGELEYAIQENRLLSLPGFGAKTQERLKAGLERLKHYAGLFRLGDLLPAACGLLDQVRSFPKVIRAELAGGVRRGLEVGKSIDLVVAATEPEEVLSELESLPDVTQLEPQGTHYARGFTSEGMELTLTFASPEHFGTLWLACTGSEDHVQALKQRARQLGLELTSEGLFRGSDLMSAMEEEEIYRQLGLAFIPPELREALGEVEAAATGRLPRLVSPEDLKGCFHVHSYYSDGVNSLEELLEAAHGRGWEFLGLSDHSQSAYYAGGLKPPDLTRQKEEIERCRQRFPAITMFWGIESDILGDGSLDYPDDILQDFDFVIASIHSQFRLSKEDMTRRLVTAMANPFCTMLGHLSGRLLLAREAYDLEHEAILEFAAHNKVIIELNTSPYRLDLDWRWLRRAKELGILISLNPDAHRLEGLDDLAYGVIAARKGWLSPEDVLNTYPAQEISRLLRRRREKMS